MNSPSLCNMSCPLIDSKQDLKKTAICSLILAKSPQRTSYPSRAACDPGEKRRIRWAQIKIFAEQGHPCKETRPFKGKIRQAIKVTSSRQETLQIIKNFQNSLRKERGLKLVLITVDGIIFFLWQCQQK